MRWRLCWALGVALLLDAGDARAAKRPRAGVDAEAEAEAPAADAAAAAPARLASRPQAVVPRPERALRSPVAVVPLVDGLASASALLLWGTLEGLVKPTLGGGLACPLATGGGACSPATLSGLDRRVLGWHSAGWGRASDAMQVAALVGAAGAVAADAWRGATGRAGHDVGTELLVLAEGWALGLGATQVLKFAVRRPRPALYDPHGARGVEGLLSFPSGHTSAVASAMAGWATLAALRHPHGLWPWAAAGVGTAVTATAAYSRVAAGKHFPVDVLAGAVVGGVAGILVPLLHRAPGGPTLQALPVSPPPGQPAAPGVQLQLLAPL